jgi:hypothetical protein
MNNILYLEVDEDITSAIDKLLKVKDQTVSIVVPKRSTLLQSIINLRLLKKSADEAGKRLVLVTNDRTATNLAGRVGLPVAENLKAKPVLPATPLEQPGHATDDVVEDEEEPPADAAEEMAPVTATAAAKPGPTTPVIARRAVGPDDTDGPSESKETTSDERASSEAKPGVSMPNLKIPNFDKMQKRLLWVGLGIGLLVVVWILSVVLETATVTLYVQGNKVPNDFNFTVDPTTQTTDVNSQTLAGQNLQLSKNLTQAVNATGTKTIGTNASGTMTIDNCLDSSPHTFVAGTQFSSGGKIFASTQNVVVPGGQGSFSGCSAPGVATVNVQASQPGDSYNLAAGPYTIVNVPASEQQGQNSIIAKGGQMSGGTSQQVTVLSQADVDKAVAALSSQDKDASTKALAAKAASDSHIFADSLVQTVGTPTVSPAVGSQTQTATLTLPVSYTELAVLNKDLQNLAQAQALIGVGNGNQVYDNGLSSATISVGQKNPGGVDTFSFNASAYGGQILDTKKIANSLRGKRFGDATDIAGQQPGVQRVAITLFPSWSLGLPMFSNNIKVKISVLSQGG